MLPEAVNRSLKETLSSLAEQPGPLPLPPAQKEPRSLLSSLLTSGPTMPSHLWPREFSPGRWVCRFVQGAENPSELERAERRVLLPLSSVSWQFFGCPSQWAAGPGLALAQGTQDWGRGQSGAPWGGPSSGRKQFLSLGRVTSKWEQDVVGLWQEQ